MLAAAALEQAGIAKIDENLLEELVRDGVARRDLGARQRLAIGHLGNREQRPERIAGLVGDHRTNPSENMGNLAEFGIAVTSRTPRSEEHTSELQSLMRISYAVFCLKKKKQNMKHISTTKNNT